MSYIIHSSTAHCSMMKAATTQQCNVISVVAFLSHSVTAHTYQASESAEKTEANSFYCNVNVVLV